MINIYKIKEIIATWQDEIQNTVIFERSIYPLVKEQFLKPGPLRRSSSEAGKAGIGYLTYF